MTAVAEDSERVAPSPSGSGPFAVVFDSPSEAAIRTGDWLSGPKSGGSSLLQALLKHLCDEPVYLTSASKRLVNPQKAAIQKAEMLSCGGDLEAELLCAGIERALCLGPVGFGALTGARTLPAPTRTRGRWVAAPSGLLVLGTISPGLAVAEPEYYRDLEHDLVKFFNSDGPCPEPDVDLIELRSKKEVEEVVAELKGKTVSCDVETTGFSPKSEKMLALGLGLLGQNGTGVSYVIPEGLLELKGTWRQIQKLVNDDSYELVFHNAKFDLQQIHCNFDRHGLEFDPTEIHDTMMLSYALDERPMGKYRSHGLKRLTAVRYDAPDYDVEMGKWLKEWAVAEGEAKEGLRRDMHAYLALDVYYTARLFPDLWNECLLEDERLLDVYEKIFMPGTIALAQVEYHGMLLDRVMYEKVRDQLDEKAAVLSRRIKDAVGDETFSPGSPKQVKDYLYDELGLDLEVAIHATVTEVSELSARAEGIRSRGTYTDPARLQSSPTAAPVLKMLARGYPEHRTLLDDIVEWRNITKNAGTYIRGLLDRCDVDGRIHGSFNLHGTASGRLSSTNPNLQNVPPASHTGIPVRSGFKAPEGYSLIDADYKQLEVRVAAELSGDPTMIQMFKEGGDPHSKTSETIYGRSDVSHYERMLGKIITFGLLYGRSPDSIATGPEAEDIVARGGKRWEPSDVREFFGNLLREWNVYADWRARCRDAPYQDGEITFSLGRKRRFGFIPRHDGGKAGRRGINTPCQGTASDFCLWSLIRLHEKLKDYPAQVICTVHDALIVEVRDDVLDEVKEIVRTTMESDTLWPTAVPLAVDLKVSERWSQEDDEQYGSEFTED